MSKLNWFLENKATIWFILAFHFVAWLTLGLLVDVPPDMADHWVWSKIFSWGYYEHPPMVAFTIKLATLLGGNNLLTLKIGTIVFSVLIIFLCFKVAKLYFNRRTATIFILILETGPSFTFLSIFWSIDHPFIFFWLLGLYFIGKYAKSDDIKWVFAFGIAAGLGGLSKYIMILLPVCLFIWCLIEKDKRPLLLNWRVYLAAALAMLIVFPNLYWNYQNQWLAINFALGKGLTGGKSLRSLFSFLGAQFFTFSGVFAIYFWIYFLRRKLRIGHIAETASAQSLSRLLYVIGLFVFVFFAVSSFLGSYTDPGWLNISYLAFFMLLARSIDKEIKEGIIRKQIFAFSAAFSINTLVVVIVLLHLHLNLFSIKGENWSFMLTGWEDTSRQISTLLQNNNIKPPKYVISREYQTPSALALYLENQPLPHSLEKPERNLWSPQEKILKSDAIFVCIFAECESALQNLVEIFDRPFNYLGDAIITINNINVRELKVYVMGKGNNIDN